MFVGHARPHGAVDPPSLIRQCCNSFLQLSDRQLGLHPNVILCLAEGSDISLRLFPGCSSRVRHRTSLDGPAHGPRHGAATTRKLGRQLPRRRRTPSDGARSDRTIHAIRSLQRPRSKWSRNAFPVVLRIDDRGYHVARQAVTTKQSCATRERMTGRETRAAVGGRSRATSSAESKISARETATSAMNQFSNAEECPVTFILLSARLHPLRRRGRAR